MNKVDHAVLLLWELSITTKPRPANTGGANATLFSFLCFLLSIWVVEPHGSKKDRKKERSIHLPHDLTSFIVKYEIHFKGAKA